MKIILFSSMLLLSACAEVDVDYSDYGAHPVSVELTVETQEAMYQVVTQCEAYCGSVRGTSKNAKCNLFCIKGTLVNGGTL